MFNYVYLESSEYIYVSIRLGKKNFKVHEYTSIQYQISILAC